MKDSDNAVCPPLNSLLCGPPISPVIFFIFEFHSMS